MTHYSLSKLFKFYFIRLYIKTLCEKLLNLFLTNTKFEKSTIMLLEIKEKDLESKEALMEKIKVPLEEGKEFCVLAPSMLFPEEIKLLE